MTAGRAASPVVILSLSKDLYATIVGCVPREKQFESVRDFLRSVGRSASDAHVEAAVRSLAGLQSCEMTAPVKMGLGLIVQTWRNTGLSDVHAREMALTQLALMVVEGDLQIADNLLLVTEQGRLWLERENAKGRGRVN